MQMLFHPDTGRPQAVGYSKDVTTLLSQGYTREQPGKVKQEVKQAEEAPRVEESAAREPSRSEDGNPPEVERVPTADGVSRVSKKTRKGVIYEDG